MTGGLSLHDARPTGSYPYGLLVEEPTADVATDRASRAGYVQELLDVADRRDLPRVILPEAVMPYDAAAVDVPDAVQPVRMGQPFGFVDVLAFGAAGDGPGGTDDLAAVDAAAAWADANGYGQVWHAPGRTFTVSADPTFPGGVEPRGFGASYDGSGTAIHAPDTPPDGSVVAAKIAAGAVTVAKLDLSAGGVVVDTDPGGGETFRVGGQARVQGSVRAQGEILRPVVHHGGSAAAAVGVEGALHTEDV